MSSGMTDPHIRITNSFTHVPFFLRLVLIVAMCISVLVKRYLTSTQAVSPGTWSNIDVGAAYRAYKAICHAQDPVLDERAFIGRMMFCFDTSPSGSSGEAVYDVTQQTAVDVTIDFAAATASAMTLNVMSYTPRVIEIAPTREVTRI